MENPGKIADYFFQSHIFNTNLFCGPVLCNIIYAFDGFLVAA